MATQLEDEFLEDDPDLILDEEDQDEGDPDNDNDADDGAQDDEAGDGDVDEAGGEEVDEDVDVVTFGGKAVETAKDWPAGKAMREHIRSLERENRELRGGPRREALGPRPRLEDFGYDDEAEDRHSEAVAEWLEHKRQADEQARLMAENQQRQDEQWAKQEKQLNDGFAALRSSGKDTARATVEDMFPGDAFGFLVKAARGNPAPFLLGLANAPEKMAELKALVDQGFWAEFISEAAVMANGVAVMRKPTTQPERVRSGTPGGGGARKDAHRERLEKEAERTGDYSALVRYEAKQTEKR